MTAPTRASTPSGKIRDCITPPPNASGISPNRKARNTTLPAHIPHPTPRWAAIALPGLPPPANAREPANTDPIPTPIFAQYTKFPTRWYRVPPGGSPPPVRIVMDTPRTSPVARPKSTAILAAASNRRIPVMIPRMCCSLTSIYPAPPSKPNLRIDGIVRVHLTTPLAGATPSCEPTASGLGRLTPEPKEGQRTIQQRYGQPHVHAQQHP